MKHLKISLKKSIAETLTILRYEEDEVIGKTKGLINSIEPIKV
jgi:hypothetical protein